MIKCFNYLFAFIIIILSYAGCAAKNTEGTSLLRGDEKNVANELIPIIERANSEVPQSFSAKFVIEGVSVKNKKFKTLGEIACDRRSELMKVSFVDSIFKSSMAIVAMEGKKIKVYMPVEKTLFEDDARFINLKNYIDVNLSFDVLYSVVTWRVPIINNYSVKQSVVKKPVGMGKNNADNSDKNEENYIVLENDSFFETISIKNNLPNKIMLINKATKEKSEFYFENPEKKNNVLYFNTIRYISAQRGERISVKFSAIASDVQFVKDKDFTLKTPNTTKIVRVN